MAEQEKRNDIDSKKKKKKSKHNSKAKVKKKQKNKENQAPARKVIKESEQDKEIRIQKEAESKVEKWIIGGIKDSWLSFKNNQAILIWAHSSLLQIFRVRPCLDTLL